MSSPPTSPLDERDEMEALRRECEHLRAAVGAHEAVDQAIGVIVAVGRVEPAVAWDVLREVSMNRNRKLRLVADTLVAWASGRGELPDDVRRELRVRLASALRPT
ncbi:ANTAR domain-containing protein [Streptomyces xanthii]|uniref:ANTAR domain-containing protein n=1 Tax=Streptomyces xanthii TaxID=2768069 RepID=A0A7H1B0S1_9ACTN|nr:ANTAR domain-containing protein [Streptomyces xanthii]QNS02326.1 ANTAR domain-containing protein [Streptomyces xanthii]